MVSLDYFDLISVEKAFFRCKRSVDIRVLLVNDICRSKNRIYAVLPLNSRRTCEWEQYAYLDDLISC